MLNMKDTGVKIAHINCGRDSFEVVLDDKHARCFMNGISMADSKDLAGFAPVVGMMVISSSHIPNSMVAIKGDKNYSDFLKNLIDTVQKSDQVKMKVLEDKPDEKDNQKPKQAQLDSRGIESFKDTIKTACECFNDVLDLSDVLLKTKLSKTVMSFKDLSNILNKVKTASMELSKSKDQCDLIVEKTGLHVGRVLLARENNLNDINVKRTVQESVDHIVADFLSSKRLLASLITSHYPLFDINPTFKKYTDYPATWYFDPSVYYSFSERYKDASDNLIDLVRVEASTIRPLYDWKIKVTGE